MGVNSLLIAIVASLLAGAMIPLGAFLARIEHIQPDWLEREYRHTVIAFGGGVLLAAAVLVLVPHGTEELSGGWAVGFFAAGGLAFALLDYLVDRYLGQSGQLLATVSDFVPEAIALGALFATGSSTAILLAILIGMQNLPEGFNAYRERMASTQQSGGRILLLFCALALLGPLAAIIGHVWLSSHMSVLGGITIFAAGGILYLTFQDIAPQARLERAWAPGLGAVAGFAFGLGGDLLIGGG